MPGTVLNPLFEKRVHSPRVPRLVPVLSESVTIIIQVNPTAIPKVGKTAPIFWMRKLRHENMK